MNDSQPAGQAVGTPLAFAEFVDEIEWLQQAGALPLGARVLSPSPQVLALAKQDGFEPLPAHEYLGRVAHERIVLAKHAMEDAIREAAGVITDRFGVSATYADGYFYYFRHFVTHLLSTVESVTNACETLAPSRIVVMSLAPRQFTNDLGGRAPWGGSYHLFNCERYAADLVARVCQAHGIDCQVIPKRVKERSHVRSVGRKVASRILAPLLLRRLRQFASRIQAEGGELVLAPGPTYRLDAVLEGLIRHRPALRTLYLSSAEHGSPRALIEFVLSGGQEGLPVAWLSVLAARPSDDRRFRESCRTFLSRLRGALEVKVPVWIYRGVDLAPLLIERMTGRLADWLDEVNRYTAAMDRLLEVLKPARIVSQMSLGFSAALGELGRERGVPALLISHGSHVPPKNQYEEIVWKHHAVQLTTSVYAHQAVQTPWAERFLERIPTRSVTHCTGPLLLARAAPSAVSAALRAELAPNGEAIVLHAGSPKGRASARPYVYETPDEYVANMCDLVDAVEQTASTILIIRFRPSDGLSVDKLPTLLPPSSRTHIRGDGAFGDFLAAADLLVSFSSTAIEEALLSHKRVLQYDPTGRYCHVPAPVFDPGDREDHAIWFVDRRDRLAPALASVLTHPGRPPDRLFAEHEFSPGEIVDLPTVLDRMSGRFLP